MLDDTTPIYLQVAAHVTDQILSGDLEKHGRVMSTNEYAEFFRINPATAAKGINLLVDDGILYKRRGVGMFVAERAHGQLLRRRRDTVLTERVDALVAEARLLDLTVDELVDRIHAAFAGHDLDTDAPAPPASPSTTTTSASSTP